MRRLGRLISSALSDCTNPLALRRSSGPLTSSRSSPLMAVVSLGPDRLVEPAA